MACFNPRLVAPRTIFTVLLGLFWATTSFGQTPDYFVTNENNSGGSNDIKSSIRGELDLMKKQLNELSAFKAENDELKKQIAEQKAALDGLKKDVKGKVNPGHSEATMKVVGRVHVDYWGYPESDAGTDALEGGPEGGQDRFNFRRMRFGVRGDLPSNMEYRIEMEFAVGKPK